jgi:hypothetical protein
MLKVCVSCVTAASYCSRLRSRGRRDRPSTLPLARSEYAGLVSGSSSGLMVARDRPRDPAGCWAARTGWVAVRVGCVAVG